jgi:hypothetical protein
MQLIIFRILYSIAHATILIVNKVSSSSKSRVELGLWRAV